MGGGTVKPVFFFVLSLGLGFLFATVMYYYFDLLRVYSPMSQNYFTLIRFMQQNREIKCFLLIYVLTHLSFCSAHRFLVSQR